MSFSGHALKVTSTAASPVSAEKSIAGSPSSIWVSFDWAAPASLQTYTLANTDANRFTTVVGTSNGDKIGSFSVADIGGGGIHLVDWWLDSNLGTFVASTAYLIEMHYTVGGTVDWYVNGSLAQSLNNSADTGTIIGFKFGLLNSTANDPNETYWIDNLKIGSSRGATDLFSDDFEGGIPATPPYVASPSNPGGTAFTSVPASDATAGAGAVAGLLSIAFSSGTLDPAPVWAGVDAHVVSWTVDRGRQFELDRTQAGTATVTLIDATGLLDVLNTSSAYYGELEPLKQIRIQEINPGTPTTVTQFTGIIEDWDYTVDGAEKQLTLVLSCVDGFDILANTEVPIGSTGQAAYTRQQVDDAIRTRLADANWPSALTDIFTGNVYVKPVAYQAGTDILTTIHDCADAEFPGVSNVFMSRDGLVCFRGRKARFNPSGYESGTPNVRTLSKPIVAWNCGDAAAQAANPSWAKIAEIGFRNAKNKIVNACLATPEGITAAAIQPQLVIDATSIGKRGVRSLKFEGLLNDGNVNTGGTDLADTKLVAQYYVANYKIPLAQITKLVFRGGNPADSTNAGTWALICGVEIGDLLTVVTTDPGGGGFNQDFFVEGIHHTADVGNGTFTQRTLTLDVSPRALYNTNTFPPTDT